MNNNIYYYSCIHLYTAYLLDSYREGPHQVRRGGPVALDAGAPQGAAAAGKGSSLGLTTVCTQLPPVFEMN
jgi:hypothetical protein